MDHCSKCKQASEIFLLYIYIILSPYEPPDARSVYQNFIREFSLKFFLGYDDTLIIQHARIFQGPCVEGRL